MITVSNLTKKYGDFLAVDNLSFEIKDGQIYGFLGPNGAGKSTTMNIIAGTLAASEGQVLIDGLDIFENPREAKKRIGYLPEIPPLYLEQTPIEYLTFVAQAKGVKRQNISDEIAKVMEETHINDVANKCIKHLSKGYRQRVGIAQALLGNPSIIILDEPTVGLDPTQIIEIRDLIRQLGKNHTVILSSHILSEVQAICQEILIIHKGKLVAFDTPDNLKKTFAGNNTIVLEIEGEESAVVEMISSIPGITFTDMKVENGLCKVNIHWNSICIDETVSTESDSQTEYSQVVCRQLFNACSKAGLIILQMTTNKSSLEDIFIELTDSGKETK